jgi:hypothetical protein
MPLLDGELIHSDGFNTAEVDRPESFFQVLSVDLLHGIPPHSQVVSDVLDWQYGAKPHNVVRQAARHASIRGQPIELLELRTATGTVQSAPRNDQVRSCVQEGQVADSPYRNIVNLVHPLQAGAATLDTIRTRFQLDLDHWMGLAVLKVDFEASQVKYSVAFPAAEDCRKFVVGQRWVSCLSGLDLA